MFTSLLLASTLSVTNLPPPYYSVYADAVAAPLERQIDILALPLRESVRANSTYVNTRRYLLGPDNPGFVMTPDGSGLGTDGRVDVRALRVQADTTENFAEADRCRRLAAWLEAKDGSPSPRARIRRAAESAIASAAAKPHPRVFATAADFAALKARAQTDPLVKSGIDKTIAEADRWIGRPVAERRMIGYQLLHVARQTVARLTSLAFAYRMTGERKYVDDAIAELEAVSAFSDWNPRHTIDTGELCLAVATAYDWLYDALPDARRDAFAKALQRLGLEAEVPFAGWTRLQNNWVQVVSAGQIAACAALAERAPESCVTRLAVALECLPEAECVCAPDGVYPEGPGYWNYGTSFNAIALDILRSAFDSEFGLRDVKGFRETALYPALVTGPSGWPFAYSDSHIERGGYSAAWWFARRCGVRGAVSKWEVESFTNCCAEADSPAARTFAYTLFWVGSDLANATPDLPDVWVGAGDIPLGVASGGRLDPDAAYVAVKGGSPSYNHAHADEGGFVLDLLGERWATDLGAENYREVEKFIGGSGLWSPEPDSKRWTLFRLGSQGHNTLLVGGRGQDPRGFAAVTRDGNAVSVDLTSVYPAAKRAVRRVSAESRAALVRDTLEGLAPGTSVRWAMLTDAETSADGDFAVSLAKGGKRIRLAFTAPNGRVSIVAAQPKFPYEIPNPGFRQILFDMTVPADGTLVLESRFTDAR